MIYWQLFWAYFKVGLFSIGGGMATIPFLYDLSDKSGWFTHAQLADMLAVSESTPGAMGVNMATYVGYTTAGIPGAVIATAALALPSIIIILLIARALEQVRHNRLVEAAFYGLRPASTALIAAAGITVVTIALLNVERFRSTGCLPDLFRWKAWVLSGAVLVLSNWGKRTRTWHPVVFIALSAVVGAVFHFAGV
ncbi:chromate transporter [Oscillibacter sp.]|uniref:chromate transporter n=1 Tax=Oscillibacter sp. TaxID=1945593 RepID=UPI002629BA71|nr:chromate transporter [Oscillibacter sp.]MDD3346348.1 chromate transporter [Oscillibacter sp.]